MIVQRLQGQKPPEDAIHHFTTVNRPSFEIKRLMFHMTYLEVTDRNVNPPRICSPEEVGPEDRVGETVLTRIAEPLGARWLGY